MQTGEVWHVWRLQQQYGSELPRSCLDSVQVGGIVTACMSLDANQPSACQDAAPASCIIGQLIHCCSQ